MTAARKVIGALGVDLVSDHLNFSDYAPDSRRRNENGKLERLGCRLRRRNDSSVNTIWYLAGLPTEQILVSVGAVKAKVG